MNGLVSALTAIPVYFSARVALHERVARVAAIAWAVYPFSIYFAADRVWDYALTAFLLSVSFWVAQTVHRRGTAAWMGFGLLPCIFWPWSAEAGSAIDFRLDHGAMCLFGICAAVAV